MYAVAPARERRHGHPGRLMRIFPFNFHRAYRLTPIGRREDDAVSQIRIRGDARDQTVLVPYSLGLGYFVVPTEGAVRSIANDSFRVQRLDFLLSLWVRLRLALLFKKKKYLKYDEFSLFSFGPKPERKRFTTFNQHMFNLGVSLDGALIAQHPELLSGWSAKESNRRASAVRAGLNDAAIVVHIYYDDTWVDIAGVLMRLTIPFDLIVTTVPGRDLLIEAIGRDFPNAEIEVMENRGRDVRPFLVLLQRSRLDRYRYVCKIHGKKSSDGGRNSYIGSPWRRRLLFDLLAAPGLADAIVEMFERDPAVGMIGPRAFRLPSETYSEDLSWSVNRRKVLELAARMGVPAERFKLDFFAGTMFWVRPEALRPLRDLGLESSFPDERGLLDGGLEHATERLFATSVVAAGYELADSDGHVIAKGSRQFPVARGAENLKAEFRKRCAETLSVFLMAEQKVALPASEMPEVSVIIVLHNVAELTLELLKSLERAMIVPTEVIIVDNASTDATRALLERLDGAKVYFNEENVHFIRAVNQALKSARGKYTLLLNNDTLIKQDAIATAVRLLDDDPSIGAVGGKIILLDGMLQEAGSIIWSDGVCQGYGRGRDPKSPEFEFRRDVDYCSAAFLMLRTTLLVGLGGLDEAFAPAYYEETDLCMRIRAAGYNIVYEPSIEVRHFEFGSSTSCARAIALQARNHETFRNRHALALDHFHYPRGSSELLARSASAQPRILIIEDRAPFPYLGSGYPRAAMLLAEIVGNGWLATFYPMVVPKVDVEEWRSTFPAVVEFVGKRGSERLSAFLRERVGLYDAVLVSRPHNMEVFVKACAEVPEFAAKLPIIYDAEALYTEREVLRRRLKGNPWSKRDYRNALVKELALTKKAHTVLTVSERERSLFATKTRAKVRVLGHGIAATPDPPSFSARHGMLFVGALDGSSEVSPNVDSLIWFAVNVMPMLDKTLGSGAVLNVAGRVEADEVRALAGPGIKILGVTPDLSELYGRSRLFVAPTRFASGIAHKVQEATAFGLPVVSTRLVADQLGRSDGLDIMVADTPAEFAEACRRLYTDANLWAAISVQALVSLERECSRAGFSAVVRETLADVATPDRVLLNRQARRPAGPY
jgi:GT2 family glycosyltransferase